MSPVITVSAVVVRRPDGRVLTVRKRGTEKLMLPGGKPEPGEGAAATAQREFAEELGVSLRSKCLTLIDVFTARAANETGHTLVATVFEYPYSPNMDGLEPRAEIDLIEWVDPNETRDDMAPLNTDAVFPLLRLKPASQMHSGTETC